MNYKVVYFTRTGTSKKVAEKISAKLSCDIIEVSDNMNWKGAAGYIKAGFYSSANKDVEIKMSKNLGDFDELIVVSPLWAGGVAPAIKAFLKSVPIEKVHLVITSKGSTAKDRQGFKTVSDIVQSKKNEDNVINELINNLH